MSLASTTLLIVHTNSSILRTEIFEDFPDLSWFMGITVKYVFSVLSKLDHDVNTARDAPRGVLEEEADDL